MTSEVGYDKPRPRKKAVITRSLVCLVVNTVKNLSLKNFLTCFKTLVCVASAQNFSEAVRQGIIGVGKREEHQFSLIEDFPLPHQQQKQRTNFIENQHYF